MLNNQNLSSGIQLLFAVIICNEEKIKTLLDAGECTSEEIFKAILFAVETGNKEIIQIFKNNNVVIEDGINGTLGIAILNGDEKALKKLLNTKHYTPNVTDELLNYAVVHGHEERVEILLETGKYNEEGINEALKSAGSDKVAKLLLETGKCNEEGINEALKHAAYYGRKEIVKLLLNTGSKEVIKKMLFNENGKLKDKFNTEEIKKLLLENNYFDKEIFEKLYSVEEGAKEISEKYQVQDMWNLEEYQKDYVLLHNIETYFLNKNLLINTHVMKFLTKMTQYYFGENNQSITHKILRYVDGNENGVMKKVYKAIMGAPKNKEKIEENKDNMKINGYVKVEVRNGTSINEYLKWANDKLEEYIAGWLSPDRYKEMQELANKYEVTIDVKDRESFNKAHKLISLKTHPDKVGKNEALNNDFVTATEIKEEVNEHFNITEKVYAPAVDVIQKANLGIKIGDASIEVVRAIHDPSIGNVVKATTGMISTTALYMGKGGIMYYTLPIEMGYKLYEEDYVGAVSSAVSGAATIFAYSALCGSMPVLSIPLTAGMTVYSGYSMLKNGYNLYNELNEEKGESNKFNIYDESLINSREIESIPGYVEEVYWDL